jgi:hypothetical protein
VICGVILPRFRAIGCNGLLSLPSEIRASVATKRLQPIEALTTVSVVAHRHPGLEPPDSVAWTASTNSRTSKT